MTPLSKPLPLSDLHPLSSSDLLTGPPLREFILLCGKDSTGKSSSIVSLAAYVEQVQPEARFYVIDTENKFRSAMRSFGADAPKNVLYYKCDDMNAVTDAAAEILERHRPGDWCAVESMSRVWERAQDLGYKAVTQQDKATYMEKRRSQGKAAPVTPKPDDLWSIVKGAHDGAFLDLLSNSDTLNVILSTTIAKPPKEGNFMKENADRKALRIELGIDSGIEGAPRLPYYVESLCMLELRNGSVTCRVLRDNLSALDDGRVEFEVPSRKEWALMFWSTCR